MAKIGETQNVATVGTESSASWAAYYLNLAAPRILEEEAEQQREATASAQNWLEVSMNRYKGGVDNYLQVTIAQTSDLSNERK